MVRRKGRQIDHVSSDVTDSSDRKWLSQEIERRRDHRNLKLRVDIQNLRESETKEKTPHRVVKLFTLNQGTPKRDSSIFEHQPYVIYNTFKTRTERNRKGLHTQATAVQSAGKDYAFLDTGGSEEPLHSYGEQIRFHKSSLVNELTAFP